MKLGERWLREWVAFDGDVHALASRLTEAGIEVGSIQPAAPPFQGVVVGEIRSVVPHPDAERLRICQVSTGPNAGNLHQIVCGAPNAAAGMKAPLALPGAVLPGEKIITAATLRGLPSQGMLCGAQELGLDVDEPGLLRLDPDLEPGADLRQALFLDENILEIELTPNRGDCLSIRGLARELAAIAGGGFSPPAIDAVPATRRIGADAEFRVRLQDPRGCARYCARMITGMAKGVVTPSWMRTRLSRAGQRCIHPVVDITNYVLLELGQPMHAFDLARLRGGIVIRRARPGEKLSLLDGTGRTLDATQLVIADRQHALALAGIMGGGDSAVTAGTDSILLESAWFEPGGIRSTARALGLQTESSYRFERGVDPGSQRLAIERATRLVLDICGGEAGPVSESISARHLPKKQAIPLTEDEVARLLGLSIPMARCRALLAATGATVTGAGKRLKAVPPGWRYDLTRSCDLIEEIARLHGYDRLPVRRPVGEVRLPELPEGAISTIQLRELLCARGYHEAVTYSFVDAGWQARLATHVRATALANPLSAELGVLRVSLLPGLLMALAHNQNRQQSRIRLFETGRCFIPAETQSGESFLEVDRIAGVIVGPAHAEQWGEAGRASDFFDIRGDVEALFALCGRAPVFERIQIEHTQDSHLHPGQAAQVSGTSPQASSGSVRAGSVGALAPGVIEALALTGPIFVFELDLAALTLRSLPHFHEISKFPSVRRDLALVLRDDIPASAVWRTATCAAGTELVTLDLFDVYRGQGVPAGHYSLALGLTLQSSSRTLTDTEVEGVAQTVVAALERDFGASRR